MVRVSRHRRDVCSKLTHRTGYNKNALDGPLKKLPQTGSSWYDDKTAGWKVSPFWPVKMPYLVIDKSKTALDNDAAWFVVGTSA